MCVCNSEMDVHMCGAGAGVMSVGAWLRGALHATAAPALTALLHRHLHVALADLALWDHIH